MTTSTPRAHKRPFGDSYLNIHLYQKTSSKKEKKKSQKIGDTANPKAEGDDGRGRALSPQAPAR